MNDNNLISETDKTKDELYLKIWEIEQQHSGKRWTITTFFLGISFAILGFSFQVEKVQVPLLPQYIASITSYWFAYILFVRLNDYTKFLRNYLSELETLDHVSIKVQAKTRAFMKKRRHLSTTKLLLYFGIMYTVGIGIIAILITG